MKKTQFAELGNQKRQIQIKKPKMGNPKMKEILNRRIQAMKEKPKYKE